MKVRVWDWPGLSGCVRWKDLRDWRGWPLKPWTECVLVAVDAHRDKSWHGKNVKASSQQGVGHQVQMKTGTAGVG